MHAIHQWYVGAHVPGIYLLQSDNYLLQYPSQCVWVLLSLAFSY